MSIEKKFSLKSNTQSMEYSPNSRPTAQGIQLLLMKLSGTVMLIMNSRIIFRTERKIIVQFIEQCGPYPQTFYQISL